ncbi:MAG: hypothetical protein WCP98_23360 [Actinomycetes bacterium]
MAADLLAAVAAHEAFIYGPPAELACIQMSTLVVVQEYLIR